MRHILATIATASLLALTACAPAMTPTASVTACDGDELCNTPAATETAWNLFDERQMYEAFDSYTRVEYSGYYDGTPALTPTEFTLEDDGTAYVFEVTDVSDEAFVTAPEVTLDLTAGGTLTSTPAPETPAPAPAPVAVAVPEAAPATPEARCEEDMPCWDCETMGNGICGPEAAPAPVTVEGAVESGANFDASIESCDWTFTPFTEDNSDCINYAIVYWGMYEGSDTDPFDRTMYVPTNDEGTEFRPVG